MLGMDEAVLTYLKNIHSEIVSIRSDMNANFCHMEQKYGGISKNMENIANELKEQRSILREELKSFNKSLDSMGDRIERGITNGIGKLVNKMHN